MSTSVKERPVTAAAEPQVDRIVMVASAGVLSIFVIAAIVAPKSVGNWVNDGFSASVRWFGLFWQILLLGTFLMAILLALTPWAKARLGGITTPEYSRFKWIAMIMCTLLAGGGVFWAAAEPMYHFLTTPPYFEGRTDVSPTTAALAQSFTHWGFLAWAILGALGSLVMLYGVERGMPLRPRTLLYPVMGERIRTSWIGSVVDVVCIIAVVAGTVGPIGFLGLQVAYGLNNLTGIPNVYAIQLLVILVLTAIIVASVLSGLDKGIQILSRLNVWMAVTLMAALLILGSAGFVLREWVSGLAVYATDFTGMALYQGDQTWLSSWTIFFFGWFMGYGPLMAIFIARISRGRTVRDLLVCVAVIPPIATTLWFTVLGGTGIWVEQNNAGAVSKPLGEGGLPAAVMAIASNLPLGGALAAGFLLLTITFVATTGDSMAYAVAQACVRDDSPPSWLRAMWALIMGGAAAVLISIGDGGISALQSFIVITAVPVAFVLLPSIVAAPIYVRRLFHEQQRNPLTDTAPPSEEPLLKETV